MWKLMCILAQYWTTQKNNNKPRRAAICHVTNAGKKKKNLIYWTVNLKNKHLFCPIAHDIFYGLWLTTRCMQKKHFNPHLCSWIDMQQNTSQWWRLSLFSFHIHWIKPKAVLISTTVIPSVPLKVLGLVPSPNTRAPLSPRCPTPLCVCLCVS